MTDPSAVRTTPAARPKHDLSVHRSARDGTYALYGNLVISIFWDRPSVAALELREPMMERAVESFPDGVGMLSILAADGDKTLPGAETRQELERQAARFRSNFVAAAVVFEYRSLYLDLLRPFLRAVATFSRLPYRFCRDIDDGVGWLVDKLVAIPGTPSAAEVIEAVGRLRSDVAPGADA